MEKTRFFIKWSIFKYVLLTILVVAMVYFFSYLKPETLHLETKYETLYEYYSSLGFNDYFKWMDDYYIYIKNYGFVYTVSELILNIIILVISKKNKSMLLAAFFGLIKVASASLFSGFALLFYSLSEDENGKKAQSKSSQQPNNYNFQNNIHQTGSTFNQTPKANVKSNVRHNLYRHPKFAPKSIISVIIIIVFVTLFIGIVFYTMNTTPFLKPYAPFAFILIPLFGFAIFKNLFGYSNKSEIFLLCAKKIQNGYTIEEVKIVMNDFSLVDEGQTIYGTYFLKYFIAEGRKENDDYESVTFFFKDGILIEKANAYHRTRFR